MALPRVLALGHRQQAAQLAAIKDVGQRLALLRSAQRPAGSRSRYSFSTQKRKPDFSAATARAWLDGAGRRVASSAKNSRRCGVRSFRRTGSLLAPGAGRASIDADLRQPLDVRLDEAVRLDPAAHSC
jgi:hypothetical protein